MINSCIWVATKMDIRKEDIYIKSVNINPIFTEPSFRLLIYIFFLYFKYAFISIFLCILKDRILI